MGSISEIVEDKVRYNLACYECLEGNLEEASRLISKNRAQYTDEKGLVIANFDLAGIREIIEAL
jgi:hypothetical protein